jgi:hypothetical protein
MLVYVKDLNKHRQWLCQPAKQLWGWRRIITVCTTAHHSTSLTPCFCKPHFNIIVPSTPDACRWFVSFMFCVYWLCHACCVFRPSRPSFLHTSSVSLTAAQYKLWSGSLSGFICPLCYFLPLRFKCFPQHPVLLHPGSLVLFSDQRPNFTPVQNTILLADFVQGGPKVGIQ